MRKLSAKGARNAWTRIKRVNDASRLSNYWHFFWRDPNDFLSQLVTKEETWLYHYGPETKQQSMEWLHSGSPHLKHSECKNPLEIFSPRFSGIKSKFSTLIIFQRAKLLTRSITHVWWFNWRTFWRENDGGRSPKRSCSCTTMTRLTGHMHPSRNWPTWSSSVLINHPILRMWPRRTTISSLDWKIYWNVAIFRSTRRSLLPRRHGLTDSLLNFFLSGLQTLEQWAKKCTDLRE